MDRDEAMKAAIDATVKALREAGHHDAEHIAESGNVVAFEAGEVLVFLTVELG